MTAPKTAARETILSQTYPEEERPCLSKYWKIYFPDREISLALFSDYLIRKWPTPEPVNPDS